MVYTIWYIPLGLWYIPVDSGIYHDATFQMRAAGRRPGGQGPSYSSESRSAGSTESESESVARRRHRIR